MKRSRLTVIFTLLMLFIGLVIGCNNSPGEPESTYSLVKANPAMLGLAKGELLTTVDVSSEDGALLTSDAMAGNYIEIPAGALDDDMTLTFSISVDSEGALLFGVEGDGVAAGEHIYFEDGKTSVIAVDKEWLSATPAQGMNYETFEKYDVTDGGTHWLIEVPHFSLYAWIITD
ncbi:MAG: hypothetical protein GF372_10645 [Candidatus Marinimicrobia bacterium]|nr:hypothetical protein [Candidatus Neomarinimicrobiota bacterium]